MSSYLVDYSTINTIVNFVYQLNENDWNRWKLNQIGISVNNSKDCVEFGRRLVSMNLEALNQRYGDEYDKQMINVCYGVFKPQYAGEFKALRELERYLYQCSEGSVMESELYKIMEDLKSSIALNIVHNLKEYQALIG